MNVFTYILQEFCLDYNQRCIFFFFFFLFHIFLTPILQKAFQQLRTIKVQGYW